jgi:Family of unknown function (DUF6232)
MDPQVLFRTEHIVITPTVARFGPVSYQVATITSVAVYNRQKLNPIAVLLVIAAFGLALFAYLARAQYPDYSLWSAMACPVVLILGVAWQRFRPVLEYNFVMRTAGGETETITTFDRAQVFELRGAVESAFLMQRMQVEQAGSVRMAPEGSPDERSDDDLHITRDWLVANAR